MPLGCFQLLFSFSGACTKHAPACVCMCSHAVCVCACAQKQKKNFNKKRLKNPRRTQKYLIYQPYRSPKCIYLFLFSSALLF